MIADMRHEAELAGGEALQSIFFGGGTPSLMPPSLDGSLLDEAQDLWGFDENIEITLEANPSSVEASNFSDLVGAGVNRISVGIQSLKDERLEFLGRLHSASEALQALEVAQANFDRVNADFIYALPGQSISDWERDLCQAIALGTDHLSLYQLTIEPSTRFESDVRKGIFTPLKDDPAADLYAITQEMTAAAGIPAYEISNYARPRQESRHNLTYWRYQDYCGIGPGAHGRRGSLATTRHKKPENWLSAIESSGSGIDEERQLNLQEQASEAILMGLRLSEGIDLSQLEARFGIPQNELLDEGRLELHTSLGLIWQNGAQIGVTPAGMPLLDALLGDLVLEELVRA